MYIGDGRTNASAARYPEVAGSPPSDRVDGMRDIIGVAICSLILVGFIGIVESA